MVKYIEKVLGLHFQALFVSKNFLILVWFASPKLVI